jgi:hypothetical protein
MADDLADEYQEYLTRFDAALGAVDVGAFAKHKGRLIKKLDAEGFAAQSKEYLELASHYFESVDRGDTINDVVVKLIREHAATLVLPSPV